METALLFDTLKTSKHLQAAGFEQEQAEALTEEFKFVVESNFAKLSTKEQVSGLETSLNEKLEQKSTKEQVSHLQEQLEQKATKDQVSHLQEQLEQKATKDQVSGLETSLNEKLEQKATKEDIQNVRDEIKDVKDELKEDIYSLKGEQKLLKWMVGFGISLNLVTLGVVLAFLFSFLPPAK